MEKYNKENEFYTNLSDDILRRVKIWLYKFILLM